MATNFSKLDSIFRMVTPADVLVSQRIGVGDVSKENSITRLLQKLLIDNSNGGTNSTKQLKELLQKYRTTTSQDPNGAAVGDQKDFDSMINFYSLNSGNIDGVKYPYMHKTLKETVNTVTFEQITGIDAAKFSTKKGPDRDMSIILSNSPFVSPMIRDAQKVELFLNFMPAIVISRCVPYLELEFAFDRQFDETVQRKLRSAGLLKFLLGGADVEPDSPDNVMFESRTWRGKNENQVSTAGMEMFTAPQTLINMNPVSQGSRYVDILDPTRPFASLESVTINVRPTHGIMSFKSATAVIKLHDRSRLAELADLIQPTTYTRSTVWLTYGWRHPYEPSSDVSSETYADFINTNMLVKEAYGVKNASFAFDSVGQVTITLELFTKTINELRDAKVQDVEFLAHLKKIESLSQDIAKRRKELNLTPPTGVNTEIRSSMILDAAESGQFPSDYDPEKMGKIITDLQNTINKSKGLPKDTIDPLVTKLKELFAPVAIKGKEKIFAFKEQSRQIARTKMLAKWEILKRGADPFLIFEEKNEIMMKETGYPENPLLAEIKSYNKIDVLGKSLKEDKETKYEKGVCSFGKLFSVFMTQSLIDLDAISDFQIIFYLLNDLCGPASCTNIAEFPIDIPVFMSQYKDAVEAAQGEIMTVEEFIKFAIDTQFGDHRAIGYGFRSKGIFQPWDTKNTNQAEVSPPPKPAGGENFHSLLSSINKGRGTFMLPQIEVFVETTHQKNNADKPVDLLSYYESPGSSIGADPQNSGHNNVKKIVRIHIYDKTVNPYKVATKILKADVPGGPAGFIEVAPDPWTQKHTASKIDNGIAKAFGIKQVVRKDLKIDNMTFTPTSNNQEVKHMVSKLVPSLIYGINATGILDAQLATKQDAMLKSAQLTGLNKGRSVAGTPAGSGQGNLPLRVIPAALTVRTIGCPLLNYSQMFFIDFNTGTTLDNVYGITGLTHSIAPGKFESSLTMGFYDAYGKYESVTTIVDHVRSILEAPDVPEAPPKKGKKKKLNCASCITYCTCYTVYLC